MGKRTEFVTVNDVPIRVDCWGGYAPSDAKNNPERRPQELVLVVPGNPGVTRFYEDFLELLHQKTKKCIWIISHGGHDRGISGLPPLKGNEHLYSLQAQIEQKKQFMMTYLSNVKVICVGHSIGSKMVLDALNEVEDKVQVEKCYLLFPTIEKMIETPNGGRFIFAYKYLLQAILISSFIFTFLPEMLKVILVKIYCFAVGMPESNVPGILELIDPNVLKHVFELAYDEMLKVKERDDDLINRKLKKLKLYYGASDGWAPVSYYEELIKKHKSIDAEVCSRGYQHSFVLKDSAQMAELLSSWINP